jgi:hypothetical protein
LDLHEVSRREKRQTFIVAMSLALVIALVGAPVVSAAVQKVKASVSDTNGSPIESEAIGVQGITQVPGSSGAVAVRTYAGGNGVLGLGDCTASTDPAQGPLPNVVTVEGGQIVTAILMTGTGVVTTTSDAVGGGQVPLLNFKTDASTPNMAIALGNGLGTTAPLTFTGNGGACNFVLLGQPYDPAL